MKLQDNLAKEFSAIYTDFRSVGNSHIKSTEMLVVSLRGVNCKVWSHLGLGLGRKVTIFAHSGIAQSS